MKRTRQSKNDSISPNSKRPRRDEPSFESNSKRSRFDDFEKFAAEVKSDVNETDEDISEISLEGFDEFAADVRSETSASDDYDLDNPLYDFEEFAEEVRLNAKENRANNRQNVQRLKISQLPPSSSNSHAPLNQAKVVTNQAQQQKQQAQDKNSQQPQSSTNNTTNNRSMFDPNSKKNKNATQAQKVTVKQSSNVLRSHSNIGGNAPSSGASQSLKKKNFQKITTREGDTKFHQYQFSQPSKQDRNPPSKPKASEQKATTSQQNFTFHGATHNSSNRRPKNTVKVGKLNFHNQTPESYKGPGKK